MSLEFSLPSKSETMTFLKGTLLLIPLLIDLTCCWFFYLFMLMFISYSWEDLSKRGANPDTVGSVVGFASMMLVPPFIGWAICWWARRRLCRSLYGALMLTAVVFVPVCLSLSMIVLWIGAIFAGLLALIGHFGL